MFSYRNTLNVGSKENVLIWSTMAFMAGSVNAGGFLACGRFVSHVTGFSTQFGIDMAERPFMEALAVLAVPFFFFFGSALSGYLVDIRIQNKKPPLYPVVMLLVSVLLTLCAFGGGQASYFGEFGTNITPHFYHLLAALCLVCGLINATVTSAYGAIIRTTHLTGITTDLGIGIVRILSRTHNQTSRQNEIRATRMRIGIIAAFTAGATLSTSVYLRYQYWGFLIPAGIGTLLFWWSFLNYSKALNGIDQ